jgi:hypothetical protein
MYTFNNTHVQTHVHGSKAKDMQTQAESSSPQRAFAFRSIDNNRRNSMHDKNLSSNSNFCYAMALHMGLIYNYILINIFQFLITACMPVSAWHDTYLIASADIDRTYVVGPGPNLCGAEFNCGIERTRSDPVYYITFNI